MSTYEIGVVHDLKRDGEIVTVIGVDYAAAQRLYDMPVGRNGIVGSSNGAIDLKPAETVLLEPIGETRLVSRNLTGRCLEIARSMQPDPDNWTWGKAATCIDDGTEYWALGLKPEQRAEDGAIIQHSAAVLVALS